MVTPDPRIAVYITEISKPGVPFINVSHGLLVDAYRAHGRDEVDKLIDAYFAEVRNETKGASAPVI